MSDFDKKDIHEVVANSSEDFDQSDIHSDGVLHITSPVVSKKEIAPTPQQISEARAMLLGAGNGSTLGFADEINGQIVSNIVDPLHKKLNELGLVNSRSPSQELAKNGEPSNKDAIYKGMRDIAREENTVAQDQNPVSYGVGEIAGGALSAAAVPGALAPFEAAEGAGLLSRVTHTGLNAMPIGAAIGLGSSDADNASDMLSDTASGALSGAAVGAGLHTVGGLVYKGGQAIGKLSPKIADSYEFGTNKIKTYGDEFAKKVGEGANDVVDKIKGAFQNAKNARNAMNDEQVSIVEKGIKELSDSIKQDLKDTKNAQIGINDNEKIRYANKTNDLAVKTQERVGKIKGDVQSAYDEIESQIPEDFRFNAVDDVNSLVENLYTQGKTPQEAEAIVGKFLGSHNPESLRISQLRELRSKAQNYSGSADRAASNAFSDFSKNLNKTRSESLFSNPETKDIASALGKNDFNYALVKNMEDEYLGKLNFDKRSNSTVTNSFTKENRANPETIKMLESSVSDKSKGIEQLNKFGKELSLIDPSVSNEVMSDINSHSNKLRSLDAFTPTEVPIDQALQANPEYVRLSEMLGQLKKKPDAKTIIDKINNMSEYDTGETIRKSLSDVLDVNKSTPGANKTKQLLDHYKQLTGQDMTNEVTNVAKQTRLLNKSQQDLNGALNVGHLGTLQKIATIPANVLGQAVGTVKTVANTTKNVFDMPVTDVIKMLGSHGTPEANFYIKQLTEATSKDSKNALLFSLQQQPAFRKMIDLKEK